MVKSLIVFYSRTGRTKTVAHKLLELVQCDIEEIIDLKKRSGIAGFLGAGKDAALKRKTTIKEPEKQASDYDLLIIGTPIWAGNITPAIRTYIDKIRSHINQTALFCTCSGKGNSTKAFMEIEDLCGKKSLATMEVTVKELSTGDYMGKLKRFADSLKII
ncbi:MAG: NAD(P)H-dependent oxidoreductase [Candidatus Odinarchaeota archaeon]